ncbi:hypothetical protein niasHS_009248 [Heterodera schachtii]|uniref:Uncharacterized protein n=1 Tax=Heterodera schachtii TaxID=97005 RepID=A0ABD2IZE2_HETSC
MDNRIYFGRIWHILGAFYRHKKAGGNISEKDREFLNQRSAKFFWPNEHNNGFPLAYCHETWYRMAKLYNESIAIGTEENGEKKAIEIKNEDAQTIGEMQSEIIEELTAKQIEEKQIQNYIGFLDNKNEKKSCKRAQFLLDILAFYQW